MDISVLGISADAERLYRFFLRNPGEGVDSAGRALGLDPDAVAAAAEILSELALIDLSDRRRVLPADPTIAIERLIEQRVDRLNAEIRRVLAARAAIARLARDRRQGERSGPDLEQVEGQAQVGRRLEELAFFAHSERLCLYSGGPLPEQEIDAALRCLRRGLTVKSVHRPAALADPRTERDLRDVVGLGGQVRVTAAPLDRLTVYDRSVAVVPIDPGEGLRGALLVREPGLVSQLANCFDGVWEAAQDLGAFLDDGSPSGLERRVLAALVTADKDETAARELDVSVRTLRRHVADIMARLGTANRFQAGVRAKEKGWI